MPTPPGSNKPASTGCEDNQLPGGTLGTGGVTTLLVRPPRGSGNSGGVNIRPEVKCEMILFLTSLENVDPVRGNTFLFFVLLISNFVSKESKAIEAVR